MQCQSLFSEEKKKRNTKQRPYNADHFTSDISLTWLISGCHFFFIKIQKIVKKKYVCFH